MGSGQNGTSFGSGTGDRGQLLVQPSFFDIPAGESPASVIDDGTE